MRMGAPISMISMPYWARYLATVPPPPSSIFPSSPACQMMPAFEKISLISPMYSAWASFAPALPPWPVNLVTQTPAAQEARVLLLVHLLPVRVDRAVDVRADRLRLVERAPYNRLDLARVPKPRPRPRRKMWMKCDWAPVLPSEPISSLSAKIASTGRSVSPSRSTRAERRG